MEYKNHIFRLSFTLIALLIVSFISFSLAQYGQNEPEIIYYNSLENRTAVSDIYLIKTTDYKNGTILRTYQTYIYSNPVNILDNGIYKPFTEVVDLRWNELSESFILSWQGKQAKIKPIIVDNQNKEYTINEIKNPYPEIIFNYNIEKTRKYRYGTILSNLSQEFQQNVKSVKFSLEELQGLTLEDIKNDNKLIIVGDLIGIYFEDSFKNNFDYGIADNNLNVGNIANRSEISIYLVGGLK